MYICIYVYMYAYTCACIREHASPRPHSGVGGESADGQNWATRIVGSESDHGAGREALVLLRRRTRGKRGRGGGVAGYKCVIRVFFLIFFFFNTKHASKK